ncbi:MAG: modA [Friedmanniella sp.]|nr:modA [Friedmanniella sp.]
MTRRRPRPGHPRTGALLPALFAVILLAALTGCSGTTAAAAPTTLTVFAAASLKQTFTTLGQRFEAGHPGIRVRLSFAGSADLASQLDQGAPADVFASADTKNMDKAVAAKRVQRSAVFASNTLQIAVPPGNPAHVRTLADLTRPEVRLVICAPAAPCGAATQQVAAAAHLSFTAVSEESSVTDVLGKVENGEADAGLVYVTDVRQAAGKVTGVTFPEASGVVNRYPIAALTDAAQPVLAQQFVDLVLGAEGQKVLAGAGFAKP